MEGAGLFLSREMKKMFMKTGVPSAVAPQSMSTEPPPPVGTTGAIAARRIPLMRFTKSVAPDSSAPVEPAQVVEMCDNPATAFKEKKDSSLTVGLNLLKSGEGDHG